MMSLTSSSSEASTPSWRPRYMTSPPRRSVVVFVCTSRGRRWRWWKSECLARHRYEAVGLYQANDTALQNQRGPACDHASQCVHTGMTPALSRLMRLPKSRMLSTLDSSNAGVASRHGETLRRLRPFLREPNRCFHGQHITTIVSTRRGNTTVSLVTAEVTVLVQHSPAAPLTTVI